MDCFSKAVCQECGNKFQVSNLLLMLSQNPMYVCIYQRSTFNLRHIYFSIFCTYFFLVRLPPAILNNSNMLLQIQMKINRPSICSSTKRIVVYRFTCSLDKKRDRDAKTKNRESISKNPMVDYDTLAAIGVYMCSGMIEMLPLMK